MIGSFGLIVFEVSAETVRTFDGFSRELSAKFTEHEVINSKPVLQHVGTALTTISFNMSFRAHHGVTPELELAALEAILVSGEEQPLFIGYRLFGKFVIEKISETRSLIGRKGELIGAEVSVSLREYDETETASIKKTASRKQPVKVASAEQDAEYIDMWRRQKVASAEQDAEYIDMWRRQTGDA